MDCRVVGISRAMGAGGEEVARLVADGLGFQLVDDEIVVRAAEKAGVSPESMEKVERSPSLIEKILKNLGTAPVEAGFGTYVPASQFATESYEGLITSVIYEVAQAGRAVILAHGASIPLAGTPGLLRVLVTGSLDVRAGRLAAEGGLDAKKARKAAEDSDAQRGDYLKRFYGIREETPSLYDLVINTDVIPPPSAAALVLAAARP